MAVQTVDEWFVMWSNRREGADMRTYYIGHSWHRDMIEVHGSRDVADRIVKLLNDSITEYKIDG